MKFALLCFSVALAFFANASQVWYLPVFDRDADKGICMVKMTKISFSEHEGYLFTDRPRLSFKFIYAGQPVTMNLDASGKMEGNAFKISFKIGYEGAILECKRDTYPMSLEPGSTLPYAVEYGMPD